MWHSVSTSRQYRNPDTARAVASRVMEKRVREFGAAFGRPPSDFEYYALWNAPNQAMSGRISRVVAERSQRFSNLCSVTKGSEK